MFLCLDLIYKSKTVIVCKVKLDLFKIQYEILDLILLYFKISKSLETILDFLVGSRWPVFHPILTKLYIRVLYNTTPDNLTSERPVVYFDLRLGAEKKEEKEKN